VLAVVGNKVSVPGSGSGSFDNWEAQYSELEEVQVGEAGMSLQSKCIGVYPDSVNDLTGPAMIDKWAELDWAEDGTGYSRSETN
jgi:hypothetical protein